MISKPQPQQQPWSQKARERDGDKRTEKHSLLEYHSLLHLHSATRQILKTFSERNARSLLADRNSPDTTSAQGRTCPSAVAGSFGVGLEASVQI